MSLSKTKKRQVRAFFEPSSVAASLDGPVFVYCKNENVKGQDPKTLKTAKLSNNKSNS